jgi:hypothetical protein
VVIKATNRRRVVGPGRSLGEVKSSYLAMRFTRFAPVFVDSILRSYVLAARREEAPGRCGTAKQWFS